MKGCYVLLSAPLETELVECQSLHLVFRYLLSILESGYFSWIDHYP